MSNVDEKITEVMPTFADLDAASAVDFKVLIFRIVAALQHRCPYFIKWVDVSFASMSMAIFVITASFFSASTGNDIAASKIASVSNSFSSAIALAQPSCQNCPPFLVRIDALNNDQSTESLTRDIFELR